MLKNVYKDNLDGTVWLGEVVDTEDPLFSGRIKIKVFGKFDEIPVEDIPWAYPGNNLTAGSSSGGGFLSVPKLGSIVSVRFDQGNLYHPEYFFNQKISNEVLSEVESSYQNAHIILYDTETSGSVKLFFTEAKGLMLDYQQSQINIKPDKSIVIQSASGNSKIEILDDGKINITHTDDITLTTDKNLNVNAQKVIIDHSNSVELGSGATEKVILGNTFMSLFNSHTHIGNLGAPTGPPIVPMTPTQLSQKNVKTL
jgi:hypothetical protein